MSVAVRESGVRLTLDEVRALARRVLPSARRYAARARSLAEGVRIPEKRHADILALEASPPS